jgi:hypothetical protein
MNTQLIRRSILAVLLITPLSALTQTSPASNAATPAAPVRPDFRLGKIETLTKEQLQVIMSPAVHVPAQSSQNEPLSDVIVRGAAQTGPKPRIPIEARPCGLTSIVWFIEHPADGWRVLTPIAVDSELDVCLKRPSSTATSQYPPF